MSFIPGLIYIGLIGGAIINQNRQITFKKIDVKSAVNLIKNKSFEYILDVRSLNEYSDGNLNDALFYESLGNNPSLINKVKQDIPDLNSKILIYCRSGNRASKAAKILIDNGYTDISIVNNGGYIELSKSI